MMTYLLLRNNKESGPYSLEGLLEAGLGPNDLVWVEGQSVCWLRPAEIQELKSLAGTNGKQIRPTVPPEKPVASTETITVEKKNNEVPLPLIEEKTASGNGAYSAYLPVPDADHISPSIPISASKDEKTVAETKYSRPLDELKELYAKDLERRMKKKGFSLQIPPVVKKAGLYAAFLALGLIAGILIRNTGKDKKAVVVTPSPAQPAVPDKGQDTLHEETVYIPETIIPEKSFPEAEIKEPAKPLSETTPVTKERSVKNNHTEKEKEGEAIPTEKNPPAHPGTEQNAREAVVRESRKTATSELASMVTVKSNDYIVGSFGGIRNLQLTVTNTSVYRLDRVTVELQYLKPLDELLKAENIVFNSIAPGGSQTLAIPKSSRGVKIRCRITRIESDEVSGNTAGN